ncbi:MAG: selenide, water dikinase SelD [Planctomycetota bacterium]|jgi:selenide,water dikinase
MPVDLFQGTAECGCAAKVPAGELASMLSDLRLPTDPRVLVGPQTLDDAGVYRISEDRCLVQTVDFFPPVARDPVDYGRIAAANSLSDVYAMGGRPLTALAIVCCPSKPPQPGLLREITAGALEKLGEAGAALLGGHSVVDPLLKFGLAVTGEVRAEAVLDNAGARPGNLLLLTKPLGTGITIMAARAGTASAGQERAANASMAALNSGASALALECGATSCTDVTGFGLLGHALQLARASGVSLELRVDAIPRLDAVLDYAAGGLLAAATYANRKYVGEAAAFADDVTLAEQDLLFDPQTSGGLLVACPPEGAERFLARAAGRLSTPCAIVGRALEATGPSMIRIAKGGPR